MKKLYFGLVILMCSVCILGCAANGVDYIVGFAGKSGIGYKESSGRTIFYGGSTVIDSLERLKSFCAEWNNGSFDEESDNSSDTLNKKIRGYNDDFFQSKALIIYSNAEWNWDKEPQIEKISINSTELIIEISLKRGTYLDKAEWGTFLIELNKTDIKNINSVVVKETVRLK